MTIDALCFVGDNLFGASLPSARLVGLMDESAIDRAVIATHRPPTYDLWPANESVFRAAAAHGDRFTSLVRIDPHHQDASTQARRGVTEFGARGVFLHPRQEVFSLTDMCVRGVLDVCAELEVAAVVDSSDPVGAHPARAAFLARQYPSVSIVLGGGGQHNISGLGRFDAHLALSAQPNLFVHTAGVYRQDFLDEVVHRYGEHRLLFASGTPHLDLKFEATRVAHSTWDDCTRYQVTHENAATIFGIGRRTNPTPAPPGAPIKGVL